MEEKRIELKTAILAHNKGFDIPQWQAYNQRQNNSWSELEDDDYINHKKYYDNLKATVEAPTQSLLQKWLREKHMVRVDVGCSPTIGNFVPNVYVLAAKENDVMWERIPTIGNSKYTYEDALEFALNLALEQIK